MAYAIASAAADLKDVSPIENLMDQPRSHPAVCVLEWILIGGPVPHRQESALPARQHSIHEVGIIAQGPCEILCPKIKELHGGGVAIAERSKLATNRLQTG